MAPFLRRRYLVCFYCNKKSALKYDGLITRWECGLCEAVNYLDENGDVADPPVATEDEGQPELQYTIPGSNSAFAQSSASNFFCSTCLKNQHLYNASISQYHVELEPTNKNYRGSEMRYYKFRRDLEKRYPQVCEDCEPRVLEQMKEAGKIAKADYLRRSMDKSRAKRLQTQNRPSFSGLIFSLGRLLWVLGLIGQLFWNVFGSIGLSRAYIVRGLGLDSVAEALESVEIFTDIVPLTIAWIICSAASLWWNPMLKQMNRGFTSHIKGVTDWYKLQFVLILARGLFCFIMSTGVVSDSSAAATRGAHIFMLGFVMMVAVKSGRSLKVDMTPFWGSTPERLANVGPRSQRPAQAEQNMADALDQILLTPSRKQRSESPPSPPVYESSRLTSLSPMQRPIMQNLSDSTPFLRQMTNASDEIPSTHPLALQGTPSQSLQQRPVEEMEWSPTQQLASKYRAFDPAMSSQRQNQLFGSAPVAENPSPFWFKVPPAPVTPAQRLRNPPNQPRLRVASVEAKDNFFNPVSAREVKHSIGKSTLTRFQHNVEFSQPKFFPPPASSESGNNLVDLLGSFSLRDEDSARSSPKGGGYQHVGQAMVLLIALFFWEQSFRITEESMSNMKKIIMIGCAAIATRTVLGKSVIGVKTKHMNFAAGMEICIGVLELAAACYGIREIAAGRGGRDHCHSFGTIMIAGMLAFEIFLSVTE